MRHDDDPFERLKAMPPRGHHAMLGLYSVGDGPDWVEMACPYNPAFLMDDDRGLVASGPILSLIDAAAGAAVIARTRQWRPMATLDMRVDYLRGARAGQTLHARATCHHLTRQVAFLNCDVHDGSPEDRVASAAVSFFFMDEA